MELPLKPQTESLLQELSARTGRPAADLVEDAMAGYLLELSTVRETLDARYDELKNGQVKPIDGEEVLAKFRRKSAERRAPRS